MGAGLKVLLASYCRVHYHRHMVCNTLLHISRRGSGPLHSSWDAFRVANLFGAGLPAKRIVSTPSPILFASLVYQFEGGMDGGSKFRGLARLGSCPCCCT